MGEDQSIALTAESARCRPRALVAKAAGSMGEYQLWASLALELVGKAALALIHPCLVAHPNSKVSLFAAAGMSISPDIKTIAATTLFDRLTHVSKRFDENTKKFCTHMSEKRNAELHSGEAPFDGVVAASWEGRYWHTAEIILEVGDGSIEALRGSACCIPRGSRYHRMVSMHTLRVKRV
jgi:hypothetical protein